MSDNPQAFPCLDSSGDGLSMRDPGMTLRDWFAGQALHVVHSNGGRYSDEGAKQVAKYCYAIADAMLAERERKP